MRKINYFLLLLLFVCNNLQAQKKPLDHSVYDSWQHIGERMISNNGRWVVYTIEPQQGDNELVIQSSDAGYKKTVPRGYTALITEDSRYVIFKIKPLFKDTREAKIRKRKLDDMPKDSIAIIELGKEEVWKREMVKTYKTPQKSFGWMAYQLEKKNETPTAKKPVEAKINNKLQDSLTHIIDSLENILENFPKRLRRESGVDEEDE